MKSETLPVTVLDAIRNSPSGIASLDVLESLRLCDADTLKTTLSRLNRSGRILRLKRGVYSENPLRDAFAAAQATFNGYLGFSSALYLHKLITEVPFTAIVVTTNTSGSKVFGQYEFRAVALKEKAVGFETINNLTVSTRAKTLFDCVYIERYSVEMEKLVDAYRGAQLSSKEWKEFDFYVKRLSTPRSAVRLADAKDMIMRKR